MTDGIIQEVFKRYWENEIKTVHNMEQELIEKIKQEFEPTQIYGFNMNMSIKTVIKILIGDKQE